MTGGAAGGHVDNSGTSSLGVSEFNQYFIYIVSNRGLLGNADVTIRAHLE